MAAGGLLSGNLDRLVSLYQVPLVDDGMAERDGVPVLAFQVWAQKTDVSDGERFRSGINAGELSSRFRVRMTVQTGAVTPAWRLGYDGAMHDIVGIKEIEGRAGLEITTRLRVVA